VVGREPANFTKRFDWLYGFDVTTAGLGA
jgi:hypothetical protein